ncbi:MAG TPA: class I SAM-dependent methyltransferase [Bryobacteraceae bacterium]|nr:class I SAM-dependent methyltransferase [Bryobacteraceae bacterium]
MSAAWVMEPGAVPQDEVNRSVYFSPGVYLYYLSKSIAPVEEACFRKYREHIEGRDVLDVGVGAGRTARHLAPLARRYEAIDYSPVMVRYFRRKLPGISIQQADFRDLRAFGDASFDFVLATANVIDALPHEGRISALAEASRVLRPGGVLGFSCHNVNYEDAFSGPKMRWSWNPVRLASSAVQLAIGLWNHRRVGPMRTVGSEYALLNDTGHFYSCLHYYASRRTVAAQLAEAGFGLADTFDRSGRELAEGADDSADPWLFYAGIKRPAASC